MHGNEAARDGRLRADAERNRQRIIAAAGEAFVDAGVAAPIQDIAARAGVGVGTLYRRFPDRDALMMAVARDCAERLVAVADHARADAPSAWEALRRVVLQGRHSLLTLGVIRPHLAAAVRDHPEMVEAGQRWVAAIARILRAGQLAGDVRPDIGPGDIALMLNLLTRPSIGVARDVAAAAPNRFVHLMLDALRAGNTTHLPGSPIDEWWS